MEGPLLPVAPVIHCEDPWIIMLVIKVEGVHPVVYDEYINIYYHKNTTIKQSNDYH
jgi:hypothetical protein